MSGYCNYCGYDRCLCDEIEKDERKIIKYGYMNAISTPRTCNIWGNYYSDKISLDDIKIEMENLERELGEVKSDLEFRGLLFKLQEQTLNQMMADRDEARKIAENYRDNDHDLYLQNCISNPPKDLLPWEK